MAMKPLLCISVTLVCTLAVPTLPPHVFTPSTDPNMNGEYLLAPTPNAPAGKGFPTNFKDYPGGVEYMDVYHGPIKTVYSQVWWTSTSNALPDEVVKRFDGKAIAIVGIETDQVRKTPEGDVRVPITMAYNHHHDTAVVGKGTHLEARDMHHPDVKRAGRKYIRLDHGQVWLPVEHAPSDTGLPTSAMFSDGNGGEYRKTFHAYAPPFAQIVESPQALAGAPMQIDTWNRGATNITGEGPFVPGPVSKNTLAPQTGPDAIYSGLLECPVSTRLQKIFDGGSEGFNDTYQAQVFECTPQHSGCVHNVSTAAECFSTQERIPAIQNATVHTKTVDDPTLPGGCLLVSGDSTLSLVFNKHSDSSVCCSAGDETTGQADNLVSLELKLSRSKGQVTISISGPSGVWFGVGFGASLMIETPYTIVVDGAGAVSERKLADHYAGSVINSSVTVVSNTVTNGTRTVVMTRALAGLSHDHYSFDLSALSIDFINAIGAGAQFAYHKDKAAASINLWPTDQHPTCVCSVPAAPFGQGTGMFKYVGGGVNEPPNTPVGETVGMPPGRCPPQPREDLLAQRNPTCDLRTYSGGLLACHHGWVLLDADQPVPWQDQRLEYYKKFRIYYQEYNASFHKQIIRQDWGIAADGDHSEYDVPECATGTPVDECNHTITGTWTPVPASGPDMYMVLAHHHCHAPTCLRLEIYNNDTGALLCRQEPVYGGTGRIDLKAYDEKGYIAMPPCMWGSEKDGLEHPPKMNGVTIHVVHITNNTYGHHGEMALPEISLVPGPLSL